MNYQLVVVVDPKVEEKKAAETLTTLLQKEGFDISDVSWLGKKDLAYPIKKKQEGLFATFNISSDTATPNGLSAKFKLDDTILRVLVLKQKEGRKKISEHRTQ